MSTTRSLALIWNWMGCVALCGSRYLRARATVRATGELGSRGEMSPRVNWGLGH